MCLSIPLRAPIIHYCYDIKTSLTSVRTAYYLVLPVKHIIWSSITLEHQIRAYTGVCEMIEVAGLNG